MWHDQGGESWGIATFLFPTSHSTCCTETTSYHASRTTDPHLMQGILVAKLRTSSRSNCGCNWLLKSAIFVGRCCQVFKIGTFAPSPVELALSYLHYSIGVWTPLPPSIVLLEGPVTYPRKTITSFRHFTLFFIYIFKLPNS